MPEPRFSLTVTGFRRADSLQQSAQLLALIFKDQTYYFIARVLEQLPVLITSQVSALQASTLRKHLEARGAVVEVELDPDLEAEERWDDVTPPFVTADEADLGSDTATSYAWVRPGLVDQVYGNRPRAF